MNLNPFHFLFESKKHPNARTLRTNLFEKYGDAFRVISGFSSFNTTEEDTSNSFSTLSSILNNHAIEHKPNRTMGIYDYLTLGIFFLLDEAVIFFIRKLNQWNVRLQNERDNSNHTTEQAQAAKVNFFTKLLFFLIEATSIINRAILFASVLLRYVICVALTLISTPIISLITCFTAIYVWAFNIKEIAYTVPSFTEPYHKLSEFTEFLEHQDYVPSFKTELVNADDINIVLIDSKVVFDIDKISELGLSQSFTSPTCIIVRSVYKDIDSDNKYIGGNVTLRKTSRILAAVKGYEGYILEQCDSPGSSNLYYMRGGYAEPVLKIKHNSGQDGLWAFCNRPDQWEFSLTPDQVNQWITSKKGNHAPFITTYQRYIVGNGNPCLVKLTEDPDMIDAFRMYDSFKRVIHEPDYIGRTEVVLNTTVPYNPTNNQYYHSVSQLFLDHHEHKTLHLNIKARLPEQHAALLEDVSYNEKLTFFGVVKNKEQLDNLTVLNFANLDNVNEATFRFK